MTDETVPCKLCGTPTTMLGTQLCNRCWELQGRIRRDPDLARKVLAALDEPKVKADHPKIPPEVDAEMKVISKEIQEEMWIRPAVQDRRNILNGFRPKMYGHVFAANGAELFKEAKQFALVRLSERFELLRKVRENAATMREIKAKANDTLDELTWVIALKLEAERRLEERKETPCPNPESSSS